MKSTPKQKGLGAVLKIGAVGPLDGTRFPYARGHHVYVAPRRSRLRSVRTGCRGAHFLQKMLVEISGHSPQAKTQAFAALRQRSVIVCRLPNSTLKLAAPGSGPAAEPPTAVAIRTAARRLTSSRAAERGANVAGRAPRGFGTWALALQLSVNTLGGPNYNLEISMS